MILTSGGCRYGVDENIVYTPEGVWRTSFFMQHFMIAAPAQDGMHPAALPGHPLHSVALALEDLSMVPIYGQQVNRSWDC